MSKDGGGVGLGAVGCACASRARMPSESAAVASGVLTCIVARDSSIHANARHIKERQDGIRATPCCIVTPFFLTRSWYREENSQVVEKSTNKLRRDYKNVN